MITYTPVHNVGNGRVRKASEKASNEIMQGFLNRSQQILSDSKVVETMFTELCEKNILRYIRILRGDRLLDKILVKLFGKKYIRMFYKDEEAKRVYAVLTCETHHEMLMKMFREI